MDRQDDKSRTGEYSGSDYLTHWERWARENDHNRDRVPAPISVRSKVVLLRSRRANRAAGHREDRAMIPLSLLYWTAGLALGTLLLGLTTRPHDSKPAPATKAVPAAPATSEKAAELPSAKVVPSSIESPNDSFGLFIVLDPVRQTKPVPADQLERKLRDVLTREG